MATSKPSHAVSDVELVAYADGELRGLDRDRVETHLRSCLACRRQLDTSDRVGHLLRDQTPLRDDPAGRAMVLARVETASRRRPSPRPVFAGPWPAAASLLLVLALLASQASWSHLPGRDAGPTTASVEGTSAQDTGDSRWVWLWPTYDPLWFRTGLGSFPRTPSGQGTPGLSYANGQPTSGRLLGAPLQRPANTPGRRTATPFQRQWCANAPVSRPYQTAWVAPGAARTFSCG